MEIKRIKTDQPNLVNEKKLEKVINKIHKLINKNNLSIREIILLYGNLGYHLGASIAGFSETGPNLEELKRAYYTDPTVDIGLMLQGLLITEWEDSFIKKPKISTLAAQQKTEKKEN